MLDCLSLAAVTGKQSPMVRDRQTSLGDFSGKRSPVVRDKHWCRLVWVISMVDGLHWLETGSGVD